MAAIKYIKRTVALDGNSISEQLPASFFNSENTAHTFIIAAMRSGQPLTLSGAVSATFLNANDAVVPVSGSIVDGAAVVTLTDACYALSGRFTLTISVNGAVVYECNSRVKRRSSATAYDPTGEISVATLSAEIAEMRTATAAANTAAAAANTARENIQGDLGALKRILNETGILYYNEKAKRYDELFTSADVDVGEKVECLIITESGHAGYIELLNASGSRLDYWGKGSYVMNGNMYYVERTIPSGFSRARYQNDNDDTYAAIIVQKKGRITDNTEKIASLEKKLGYIYNGSYLCQTEAAKADEITVFSSEQVEPGRIIEYDFTVDANQACYLEFLDSSNNRLKVYGKLSSGWTATHISGNCVVPGGYARCIVHCTMERFIDLVIKYAEYNDISDRDNSIETASLFDLDNELIKGSQVIYGSLPKVETGSHASELYYANEQYNCTLIDMGYTAGRKYVGTHIYRMYVYDEQKRLITYLTGTAAAYSNTFDFADVPHRYIVPMWNKNHQLEKKLFCDNRVLINETFANDRLNMGNVLNKNAFFPNDLFPTGNYRMPFVQYTANGVLLLGCEWREGTGADNSSISIVICRSFDNGKTFTDFQKILPYDDLGKTYQCKSCGQFLLDTYTGRVYLFCYRENDNFDRVTNPYVPSTYNTDITYIYTDDEGETWSAEQHIDLRTSDMGFICPSPGNGITTKNGTLVMPAWIWYSDGRIRAALIYSADHGTNWVLGGVLQAVRGSECNCVEYGNSIIFNIRDEGLTYRALYKTDDLGATWTPIPGNAYILPTPVCSAGFIKIKFADVEGFLYSSPMDRDIRNHAKLYYSTDCSNWTEICQISDSGYRGYTSLATYKDNLVIAEESALGQCTCETIKLSQLSFGEQRATVQPFTTADAMNRGELRYDITTNKLLFKDANDTVHTVSFSD